MLIEYTISNIIIYIYIDYYDIIEHPICLKQIKRKLENDGYGSMEDVASDMDLMFEVLFSYIHPVMHV